MTGSQAGGGAWSKRRLQVTAALPIVEQVGYTIEPPERQRLDAIARRLLLKEPALDDTAAFAGGAEVDLAAGSGPWPALVIEDHSAIALFETAGDLAYSYRAMLLAGGGDLVVIGVPPSPSFEAYCREVLGLGRVEILRPRAGAAHNSLALRAADDFDLVARAAQRARRSGGLNLLPYMGTGGVWTLAGRIAVRAGRPLRVAAPPPRLARRVNDKLWFALRIAEVLGPQAAPTTASAYGLAALAGRVRAMSERFASVAVKLVDSASSAGNLVLDARELADLPLVTLARRLRWTLHGLGWRGGFPVMVSAWEAPVLASPSVQLWLPPRGAGLPVIEGVFDQTVLGRSAVFSGATQSALPPAWLARLAGEAGRLAVLLQELGYVGRCSFDAILVGETGADAALHWVECNGRWGGVSIPMTLANRLLGDWTRRAPVIVERCDLQGPRRRLESWLARLSEDLYRPESGNGTVLLAPGRLEAGEGFEILVLGENLAAARAQAESVTAKLTTGS
jgi:hypothetical protein